MANLYEALQRVRNQGQIQPVAGQQQDLEQIALTRGGKAQQAVGPRASNLGEQQAQSQAQTAQMGLNTQTAMGADQISQEVRQQESTQDYSKRAMNLQRDQGLSNLAQRGQIAGAQLQQKADLAGQELGVKDSLARERMSAAANMELLKLSAERDATMDNLFRDFKRSSNDLADRKDAAELEQVAFLYSLQDKNYLAELDRIGRERGMMDEIAFRNETQDVIWGNEFAKTVRTLGMQQKLGDLERAQMSDLATINLDQAVALARASAMSEGTKSIISGTTSVVKEGADIYDKRGK